MVNNCITRIKIALLFATIIISVFVMAPVFASDSIAGDKLTSILDKTTTFSADFKQIVVRGNKKISEPTIGRVYSQKPNLFRWEIFSPYENLIILNDNKLFNYDIDLEQVTVQQFSNNSDNTPFFLSGNSDNLLREYHIEEAACNKLQFANSNACFRLTTKIEGISFQHIVLGFKMNTLSEMKMLDQLDQTTYISFTNQIIDKLQDKKLFKLKIPAGVDVIENN